MSGALAGGLTSVIATPADLVKSRLQIQYRQAAHVSSRAHCFGCDQLPTIRAITKVCSAIVSAV